MAESAASPGAVSGAAEQPSLRRVMGPGLLLMFVVGDILGTGIYALTGQVAARVGGAVGRHSSLPSRWQSSPRSATWSW
jgi:basic amino acid/polyamine antiporter, APA family